MLELHPCILELNQGHNWAEDHMSVAKENITHVFNFLSNKEVTESVENHNYMFFGNIENAIVFH